MGCELHSMRHLLLILALCLPSFGAIALVQSRVGGTGTSTCTTPCAATTSSVGFASPTTAGNLIVCIAWATETTAGTADAATPVPTTSGFSWTSASFGQFIDAGSHNSGKAVIYYIANAASMNVGTVVNGNDVGSGTSVTIKAEFDLYEFSGVALTTPRESAVGPRNNQSGNPDPGNITFTNTDLVISVYSSLGGTNISPGSGYTLGFDAAFATTGQIQYQLNASPGTIATAFSGGAFSNYGAGAAAFKPPAVVPSSGVARHKGWMF